MAATPVCHRHIARETSHRRGRSQTRRNTWPCAPSRLVLLLDVVFSPFLVKGGNTVFPYAKRFGTEFRKCDRLVVGDACRFASTVPIDFHKFRGLAADASVGDPVDAGAGPAGA